MQFGQNISKFGQIYFEIWTNIFWNLDKYNLKLNKYKLIHRRCCLQKKHPSTLYTVHSTHSWMWILMYQLMVMVMVFHRCLGSAQKSGQANLGHSNSHSEHCFSSNFYWAQVPKLYLFDDWSPTKLRNYRICIRASPAVNGEVQKSRSPLNTGSRLLLLALNPTHHNFAAATFLTTLLGQLFKTSFLGQLF